MNRLYFIENYHCVHTLSFDPARNQMTSFDEMRRIAESFMTNDEVTCMGIIANSHLIADSLSKKLGKYYRKQRRKRR